MEITPYNREVEKPWGKEIIFTQPELERAGKVLFVKAGCRLSLQYHTTKEETILLFQGEANIWLGSEQANVRAYPMQLQKGYTIVPGVIHRLEAVRDSYFFEVSSPEKGTTYRLEDDYKRENEEFPH